MTFSFNFQIDSESSKETGKSENGNVAKTVKWVESKEHFVGDVHRQQASRPENVETMMVGEVSVHYISSESVTHGLLNSDYSGDLEPALQDNTDLVPGKYEVRENVILRHPSYFLEVCLIGWLEDLGVLY